MTEIGHDGTPFTPATDAERVDALAAVSGTEFTVLSRARTVEVLAQLGLDPERAEWFIVIQGEKGYPGEKGDPGKSGAPGARGPRGRAFGEKDPVRVPQPGDPDFRRDNARLRRR